MNDRAREQAPGVALRPLRDEDEGVSPVIGMILVLAISIVGIAAILYWGLPAIDEMKANVEYRSVTTQFSELDSTIRELVSGTTEKTAKRWEPAINRGSVNVMNDTEPWLYEVEFYNTTVPFQGSPGGAFTNFSWTQLTDGDYSFRVYNHGRDLVGAKVEAFIVTGTSSLTSLNVSGGTSIPATGEGQQMDGTWLPTWGNNTYQDFRVYVANTWVQTPYFAGTKQPLDGQTFKFRIWTGNTLLAEAWYTNTSRVDYTLHTTVSDKTITENNGAVITGASGSLTTISNSPPIPPVTNTSGVPRFFGRLLSLQGNTSFAGDNRFDLLISLYSTSTLASYDCGKSDGSDCAVAAKIYVWGSYAQPWQTYLNNTSFGYHYGLYKDDANAGIGPRSGETVLEDREWKMAYTLLESNVRVTAS